ncbi:hypothetical protein L596_004938 [Steinernema carpocapsae]|uniref:Uncharacterized protein n=1 Tax=Steinernema carpocapsae TaxID=34508 RepID=A0A4U8UXM5_STECR|nr:hypothetical protein L596_004938 [Steinernema carpocapsae]
MGQKQKTPATPSSSGGTKKRFKSCVAPEDPLPESLGLARPVRNYRLSGRTPSRCSLWAWALRVLSG